MSSWNSQSCLSSQNGEKRKIARLEVRSPFKIHHLHHFVWLVCETRAKILLSDPETWLTSPVASLLVEAIETIVWKPEIALVDVQIVSKFFGNYWGDPDDHMETRLYGKTDSLPRKRSLGFVTRSYPT